MSMVKHHLRNMKWNSTPAATRLVGLVLITLLLTVVYGSVLIGHASLKTNSYTPTGPLFVGDPLAGGSITVPLEYLVTRAWSHFQLPAIDPYQAFGIPLLSSQSVPVFVPEIITHMLFPNNYSIWNFLRLDILAYGTFLLAFSFDFGLCGSLAAGIASALVGVAPPNVNLEMLNPLMMIPFVLLSLRYLLDPSYKRVITAWLGFVTSVTLLALSGFQEVLPLLAVLIAVFALSMAIHYRVFQLSPRRLIATLTGGVIALLIGAIGYLPTLSIVRQGFGVNSPKAHLQAASSFWLGTLAIPKINGASLVLTSPKHTFDVWILGTPVLLIVILLAALGTWKYFRNSLWLTIPSLFLILVGILCFSDELGILNIFGFFPFNSILMTRFFGFVWWIPWCLLLAMVISNAKRFSLGDILVSLVISIVTDIYLMQSFTSGASTHQLQISQNQSFQATGTAITLLILFALAIHLSQRMATTWPPLVVFIAATLLAVPTNFFPKGASQAATGLSGNYTNSSSLVDFAQVLQPPAFIPAINSLAPIISPAYLQILQRAFPNQFNYLNYSATKTDAPTLYYVGIGTRLIQGLATLGVNELATPSPLNLGLSIPNCQARQVGKNSLQTSHATIPSTQIQICDQGVAKVIGNSHIHTLQLYKLIGVDPLVMTAQSLSIATSQEKTLADTLTSMNKTNRLGSTAFLDIGTNAKRSTFDTHLATNPKGIKRTVTTETITTAVRTSRGGLLVLRNSYLPGMTCSVNGHNTTCFGVDGGLWTAVQTTAGNSTVTLNYVNPTTRLEELVGILGSITILLAWLTLAVKKLQSTRTRFTNKPETNQISMAESAI
jgi:hypothetical protein